MCMCDSGDDGVLDGLSVFSPKMALIDSISSRSADGIDEEDSAMSCA